VDDVDQKLMPICAAGALSRRRWSLRRGSRDPLPWDPEGAPPIKRDRQ